MTTNFGDRSSAVPLPMGVAAKLGYTPETSRAWPASGNYLTPDSGATIAAHTGIINRPERCWVRACGQIIVLGTNAPAWVRYDFGLRLTDSGGTPVNDLNGRSFFQNANSNIVRATTGSSNNSWIATQINGLFFLEAGGSYLVQLITYNSAATTLYWAGKTHYNLWAHTEGEGSY